MVVFKQLISSALAITSISGISTGVFFTAKHTIFDTISTTPKKKKSVTAKSSNIKKTVSEPNYKYYVVKPSELIGHSTEDLEEYKCSSTKDGASSNLFDCVLLKLATKSNRFDNKYLDDANTEFSSGEKIFADTKYLLKILSTTTNNSPFYLQNTKQQNIFATLTTEFSYSTSAQGLESDIVVGKATKIQNNIIPKSAKETYDCDSKEKCKAFEIKGTPTEDTLINYNYSTISTSGLFDFEITTFTVVKFSKSKDINFWKSKKIVPIDEYNQKFIFTPLYLMVGTIDAVSQQNSNLFVVK